MDQPLEFFSQQNQDLDDDYEQKWSWNLKKTLRHFLRFSNFKFPVLHNNQSKINPPKLISNWDFHIIGKVIGQLWIKRYRLSDDFEF